MFAQALSLPPTKVVNNRKQEYFFILVCEALSVVIFILLSFFAKTKSKNLCFSLTVLVIDNRLYQTVLMLIKSVVNWWNCPRKNRSLSTCSWQKTSKIDTDLMKLLKQICSYVCLYYSWLVKKFDLSSSVTGI